MSTPASDAPTHPIARRTARELRRAGFRTPRAPRWAWLRTPRPARWVGIRSPRTTPRITRCALRAAVALGLSLGLTASAAAWGPGDALARPDGPRVSHATERLRWAGAELARILTGFGAELSMTPGLAYGADVEDPARAAASLALDTELRWTWDAVGVLAAETDVARAAVALDAARRMEGKEALELLGNLLRARLARDAAEADLAEAHATEEAARRGGDPVATAHAALDLREAELSAADARADVATLERVAAELGLAGEPTFVVTRFALPIVDPAATLGFRIRSLEAAELRARAERERTFGALRDLEFAARWESRTDQYQLDASIGLPGGRPTAAVGAAYGPQQDDQWHVALTARIVIDDRTARDLAAVDLAAAHARTELELWTAALARDAAEALRLAQQAEARVDIAVQRLRAREAEARDARDRGADTARLDAAVLRDLDRTYLAWLRYVEEVDDYLGLVGAPWEIAGEIAAVHP